jgi:hypothetical protein
MLKSRSEGQEPTRVDCTLEELDSLKGEGKLLLTISRLQFTIQGSRVS